MKVTMACLECDTVWDAVLAPAHVWSSTLRRVDGPWSCPECGNLMVDVAPADVNIGPALLWPDEFLVHDLVLYVRLACGHERVAKGWRGDEGEQYCCEVCLTLTTIECVAMTDEEPCPWRKP